jgi:hypothetical protein
MIPMIFELSNWSDDQQTIKDWLLQELYEKYKINPKSGIFEPWIERRRLLPMLDGLDELGFERQKLCAQRINEFVTPEQQVVVCCRVKEFELARISLTNLSWAVQLQPLTDGQIQNYLAAVDKSALWEQIQTVPEMRQMLEPVIDPINPDYNEPGLLRVPLFISLAARVFEADRPLNGKADLFDRYIVQQLELDRRENDHQNRRFKNRKWAFKTVGAEPDWREITPSLAWIAKRLKEKRKVELLIEKIQPNWLDSHRGETSYKLINGLISSLIIGLIFALIGSRIDCLILGLIVGPIVGLIIGLTIEMFDIQPFENFQISMSLLFRRENFRTLYRQLALVLVLNLIGILSDVLVDGKINNLDKVIPGSFSTPIMVLITTLIQELKGDLNIRLNPNQGVWNSLRSFFWITSLSYPFGIVLVAAMTSSFANLTSAIIPGIGGALFFGFLGGLFPVIQHLSLRIVLTRHHKIPWNLARFLTYCHERRLLQQIGGRYRFIHRELLDHLAKMEK